MFSRIHLGNWTYWVTEKKWPPIYSQHFQIPCIVWEWLHFDSKFTEIFRGNLTNERLRGFRFNNFLSNVLVMLSAIPIVLIYIQHYCDVILGTRTSQITSLTIVYSTFHSGADQIKHQIPASLTFVRGIHRWPVNSPHKWPVKRKMFPFDDVIMNMELYQFQNNRIWP